MKTHTVACPTYQAQITPLGPDKAYVLAHQLVTRYKVYPLASWTKTRDEVLPADEVARLVRKIRAARK